MPTPTGHTRAIRASRAIGTDVYNSDHDKIGEVEEILVDDSGSPVAAVIEAGGFLDIGDEDIVVSLDELTFENGDYTTSMTEEELEELPTWDD